MNVHSFADRDAEARAILTGNDRGGYTVPTAGLYPYQWNWDSAFSAWGFATFDTDRAWREVETLMAGQWPSGMVPHILFHQPDPGYFPGPDVWGGDLGPVPSSGISQPAVAASVLRQIHARDPDNARLEPLVERLQAWHRWFMAWRVADGAVFTTHPWESGRDNSPDWDAAMAAIDPAGVGEYTRRDTTHVNADMRPTKDEYDRYVWLVQRGRKLGWDEAQLAKGDGLRVLDPTMHFILLRANRDLKAMLEALGRETDEVAAWSTTLEAGVAQFRKPDAPGLYARYLTCGTFSEHVSSASFLCWYAGVEDAGMLGALKQSFSECRFPVPSLPANTQAFDAKRYWRGPVWAFMNSMIARGLAEMGHRQEAAHLRQCTCDLIAEHGFAEYFDPLTGAPAGGGKFSWTAAVWLAWASPRATEGD